MSFKAKIILNGVLFIVFSAAAILSGGLLSMVFGSLAAGCAVKIFKAIAEALSV